MILVNLIEKNLHFTTEIARFLINENFSDVNVKSRGRHEGMEYQTDYKGVQLTFVIMDNRILVNFGRNKGGHISHYYFYKKNSFNSFQKAYKKMVNKREFLEDLEAIPYEEYSEEYRLYLELKEKYDQ